MLNFQHFLKVGTIFLTLLQSKVHVALWGKTFAVAVGNGSGRVAGLVVDMITVGRSSVVFAQAHFLSTQATGEAHRLQFDYTRYWDKDIDRRGTFEYGTFQSKLKAADELSNAVLVEET